jgi:hypothetical protein
MAAMAAAGIVTPARAQFPIPTPGDLVRGASDRAKREAQRAAEEALAKTLFPLERENRRVLRQAPRQDKLDFRKYRPMKELRRTPSGGFILKPGAWEFEAQSFCILAGTHQRTGGAGYRAATLSGKMAPTVRAILGGAYRRPDIRQHDIQRLLWSILTGLSYREFSPSLKTVAQAVLTPAEISAMDGAAADIPASLPPAALSRLPPAVRDLITARERLRAVAARPDSSYGELERIAVLPGLPPKTGQEVPANRWSWHPDGYLIRYFSESFTRTRIQIVMGEPLQLARDAKGRVTRWSFASGRWIEFAYREDLGALRHRRYPKVQMHFFERVTFHSGEAGPRGVKEFRNKGFVFFATRRSRRSEGLFEPKFASLMGAVSDAPPLGYTILARADDPDDAREVTEGLRDDIRDRLVEDAVEASGSEVAELFRQAHERQEVLEGLANPDGIEGIGDANHLREGIGTIVTGDTGDRIQFIGDTYRDVAASASGATETIDQAGRDEFGDDDPAGGAWTDTSSVHFDTPTFSASPSSGGQDRGLSGRPAFP